MPQLMPFYWKNSVFMVFLLLMVLVFFYYFKKIELMNVSNFDKDMIMFKFMW